MNKLKYLLMILSTVILLSSCNFISNSFKYNNTTQEFIEALLAEDYDQCVGFIALDHETAINTNIDTLKLGFKNFRSIITNNFGTELSYSFMKAEKVSSTIEGLSTPPNTTVVFVEFTNDTEFGVFKVLFDDSSKKIISINTLDIKKPIPSMTLFWIFGIFALCIPIFNIYMIVMIKRSELKKKWRKYMGVIVLNVPSISYAAVGGLSFKLLSFQILLGISFSYMGFLTTAWTFGLPLGGIYWFWKLKMKKTNDSIIPEEN